MKLLSLVINATILPALLGAITGNAFPFVVCLQKYNLPAIVPYKSDMQDVQVPEKIPKLPNELLVATQLLKTPEAVPKAPNEKLPAIQSINVPETMPP